MFVTHEQLKKNLSFKLDTVWFTDFLGRHNAEQTLHDPIPAIREQLHNIERRFLDLTTKGEVARSLEPKADIDMIRQLERQDKLTLEKIAFNFEKQSQVIKTKEEDSELKH